MADLDSGVEKRLFFFFRIMPTSFSLPFDDPTTTVQ